MPATLWSDIVGYTCIECGKWATHWYGNAPLCCSCHIGSVDIYMEQTAIEMNTKHQKGLPLEALDVEAVDIELTPYGTTVPYENDTPSQEAMEHFCQILTAVNKLCTEGKGK